MALSGRVAARITDYHNPESVASRLRARRIAPLLDLIRSAHARHGDVSIVDIGGTAQYWSIVPRSLLREYKVRVTIVNLPGVAMPDADDVFTYREGDGCQLTGFRDKEFHVAHSNSVLEHVGDWGQMSRFASEVYRVSERSFIQTPNFWFVLEPHCMTPFFHWLPEPTRVWLVTRFQLGNWSRARSVDQAVRSVQSARLVSRRMMQALFPESRVETERFMGLPKSLIAIKR